MRTMFLLVPALALLAACDSECDDPTRIDGQWAVFANATSSDWQVTGFTEAERTAGDQAELLSHVFPNGWSTWDIRYTPGRDRYSVEIDGQSFEATHSADKQSCNRIQLDLAGIYQAPEGSTHEFDMSTELVWTGDVLVGSYAYAGSWALDDKNGDVRIPAGELRATQGSAPDTGG